MIFKKIKNFLNRDFNTWSLRFKLYANIVIVLQVILIGFALFSYRNAKSFNEKQIKTQKEHERVYNALDAIKMVYDVEFLNHYKSLNKASNLKYPNDAENFYYVINTYYLISVIVENDIADNKIIKESIQHGIRSFMSYPIYKSAELAPITAAITSINNMCNKLKMNDYEN